MVNLIRVSWLLVFYLPILAVANTTQVDPLAKFLSSTTHLSGQFWQVIFDERGEELQNSSGEFVFERPGKFKWNYIKPYEQQVICDGQQVWIYDVDLAQVTTKAIDATFATTPAMVLLGKEPVEQRFKVVAVGESDGLDWIELTAKQATSEFEQISLGFKLGELLVMKVVDAFGQTTQLTFAGLDRSAPKQPISFSFIAPPGVEVVNHE